MWIIIKGNKFETYINLDRVETIYHDKEKFIFSFAGEKKKKREDIAISNKNFPESFKEINNYLKKITFKGGTDV